MRSKKPLLAHSNVYLILDRQVNDYDELSDVALKAVQGGIRILQIRDKRGQRSDIAAFSRRLMTQLPDDVIFVINDDVALAAELKADAVHVGQDDMSVEAARRELGESTIIGASCQTMEQAYLAQDQGADYIGFGSVFKTLTKPDRHPMEHDLLRDVVKNLDIPVYAIGGIDLDRLALLKSLGVSHVAVCRAVSESEDVEKSARQFVAQMTQENPVRG